MEQTYRIPEANIGRLIEQLDKLAKKAKRLGLAPITTTITGYEDVPGEQNGIPIVTRYALLTVTGEAPRYAGWTFVASLDFVEGGTVLRTVPGLTVPDTYRNADNYCDHCHSHRQRLGVFVVRHEDGTYRQIGRNCLANFIGGIDPHNLAANAEYLMTVRDLAEDAEDREYGGPGGGRERLSSRFYLSVVAGAIRTWGWMSRTKARELNRISTAERVDSRIRDMAQGKNAPSFTRGDDDSRDYWTVTGEDSTLAETALTYAREYFDTTEPDGEYEYNLQVLTRANSVEWKHTGLLASLLPWYRRKVEHAEQRKQAEGINGKSEYVGAVKDKVTLDGVTVEKVVEINGSYGLTLLHKMRDAKGNVLVWFSSSERLDEGEVYTLKGTVKAQEDYQGTKQTVLTRCKVA